MRRRDFLGTTLAVLGSLSVPVFGFSQETLSWREDLLERHNQIRRRYNRGILKLDPNLGKVAQDYAEVMARRRRLDHRLIPLDYRMRQSDYASRKYGENIAYGHRDTKQVFDSWWNSRQGHRVNILEADYEHVGFGHSNGYWCAVYAAPWILCLAGWNPPTRKLNPRYSLDNIVVEMEIDPQAMKEFLQQMEKSFRHESLEQMAQEYWLVNPNLYERMHKFEDAAKEEQQIEVSYGFIPRLWDQPFIGHGSSVILNAVA